jgi:hypothetical protein
MNKFSVEGQQIIGLRGMYDAILNDSNSNELMSFEISFLVFQNVKASFSIYV